MPIECSIKTNFLFETISNCPNNSDKLTISVLGLTSRKVTKAKQSRSQDTLMNNFRINKNVSVH